MQLFKFYKDNPDTIETYQFPIAVREDGILGFYYDKWGIVEEWRVFEFKEKDEEAWPDEDVIDGNNIPKKEQLIKTVFIEL